MRCGFRLHDRDRTTESMEGIWMGSWDVVNRGWAEKREGFRGYTVNHWGIKRPPNGTKFDGRSTGDIPRPLGKSQSILRTFFSRSRNKI